MGRYRIALTGLVVVLVCAGCAMAPKWEEDPKNSCGGSQLVLISLSKHIKRALAGHMSGQVSRTTEVRSHPLPPMIWLGLSVTGRGRC